MKNQILLCAAVAALTLAACNSTTIESSYKSTKAPAPLAFKKILVVAITPSPGLRRTAEEAMAKNITTAEPVRSYDVFPDDAQIKDHKLVAAKMKELGIDGIVTLRPLYNRQELNTYSTGSYPYPYHSYYGYAGYGWGASWGTEVTVDDVVGIETNIYTANNAELVWSGMTKSVNVGNADALVTDVAKTVRKELEKQGLLLPAPKK